MFYCATCRESLDRLKNQFGTYHFCSSCHGRLVGLGVLRKSIKKDAVNRVWRIAFDGGGTRARPCPVCAFSMSEVATGNPAAPTPVDVCCKCHMVWFDGGEFETMPKLAIESAVGKLSPKAEAALAYQKINLIREQAERDGQGDGEAPDDWWKWVPAMFSLPVELHTRSLFRRPLVTYFFAALMMLIYLMTLQDPQRAMNHWGFIPGHPFRYGGMTMIISTLLHGGWLHLAGNLYFLLIFGDDVEEYLGPPKLIMMMVVAAMAGCLFHTLSGSLDMVPLIGASGVISAILCFYSLLHPHARIGLLVRYHLRSGWIGFSARTAFVLWILWQLVGMWLQFGGLGQVSAFAHLGGVLVGILAWAVWRDQ